MRAHPGVERPRAPVELVAELGTEPYDCRPEDAQPSSGELVQHGADLQGAELVQHDRDQLRCRLQA
jgi:hypothetical protein